MESNSEALIFLQQKPQIFVSILLRIYRKYTDLIKQSFRQDAGFVASMDKVSEHEAKELLREEGVGRRCGERKGN